MCWPKWLKLASLSCRLHSPIRLLLYIEQTNRGDGSAPGVIGSLLTRLKLSCDDLLKEVQL